jgi:hypothetical protein
MESGAMSIHLRIPDNQSIFSISGRDKAFKRALSIHDA